MKDRDLFFNAFHRLRIAPFVILCMLLVGFLLSAPSKAIAGAANTYEVRDVKVDLLAESSLEARDKAFTTAQTEAFKILAARFLSADEIKSYEPPEFKIIQRLVRDVELVSEKASTRRYVGVFNIRFKPSATRNHFGKAPHDDNADDNNDKTKQILLPFFMQNNQYYMWNEQQNPFIKLIRNAAAKDFIIPTGDTFDRIDIKDDFMQKPSKGLLKRLYGRYGRGEIIIMVARFDPKQAAQLSVDFYRTDWSKIKKTKTIEFPVKTEKTLGDLLKTATPIIVEELNSGMWRENTPPKMLTNSLVNPVSGMGVNNSTNPNNVPLNPAITKQGPNILPSEKDAILNDAQKPQKPKVEKGETYAPQAGKANMIVQYASVNEWIKLRRDIISTPSITGVRLVNLKTFEAEIEVGYIDEQSMLNNLVARGFHIRSIGDNSYLLMRGQ